MLVSMSRTICSRTLGLVSVLLSLGLFGAGCQSAPIASYHVHVVEGQPDRLAVTLELSHLRGDSVTLRGYASKEVLGLADFTATAPDGSAVQITADFEKTLVNKRTLEVPRFRLHGDLPPSVTVRYLVRPGSREGDSHMGYTGRSYGHAGGEFGFVTGRNLFLIPQPAEDLRRIEVRFSLPEAWEAKAPWRQEGEVWLPGVGREQVAAHLISAAIGMGRFREQAFDLGATRFRLAFEAGIPPDEEKEAARRMELAARYVHGLFGRDLGPEYLVVVAPRAPGGDELAGEGWATGQGETLVPITANRLKLFAERLIEAYVRHPPYRTEIRRPEEFWLVDAVKHRYAWLAAVRAGFVSEDQTNRAFAVSYLTTLQVQGLEMNLEKIYSASGGQSAAREELAPFVLLLLDQELRSATKGNSGFDSILPRIFRGGRAESLWSLLPSVGPRFWEDFRLKYVQGTAVAPVDRFYALQPAGPTPQPPAGAVARRLTLAYTGGTTAYLEDCGCKSNQSGGVARRASALERIRRQDPDVLILDAGDAFLLPKNQSDLDFLSREEQTLYLRTMDSMGYRAAAIGHTELRFGLDHFRKHVAGLSTPFLGANIRSGGKPVAPASVLLTAGRVRVAVIGLLEVPRGRETTSFFEEHVLGLEIEDPLETLRRELPALAKHSDLVIAMGRLTPFTIRRIAEACPDLDIIISTEYGAPTQIEGHGEGRLHREDQEGFVGRTLVLYTHFTSYGLSTAKLGIDADGRVATASLDDQWLTAKVPDHPRIRAMLNQFYDRVGRLAAAQESVPPLFADDPVRLGGRYVGVAVCAGCHEAEHRQWSSTTHASAFKTLLDRHRHFQPKCVSCHVVGYGTPHGYRLGMPEHTLANVQCEICHGPGAQHAEAPAPANIQRLVPEKICLECHNPEHSDHFVYAERLPKVRHIPVEAPEASASGVKSSAGGSSAGAGHGGNR